MRRLIVGLAAAVVLVGVGTALADPVVPGFNVEVYANVTDPATLSFDLAGSLYVGSLGDVERIHRVGVGGSPVVKYGNVAIEDPDIVLFDNAGTISGTPGSVLVGGGAGGGVNAQISAILPDQSVIQVFFLPDALAHDIEGMAFDSTGRLLFTEPDDLLVTSGEFPTTLVSHSVPIRAVAIDTSDNIYVSATDGKLMVYDPSGILIDGSFAAGVGDLRTAFAPGGPFGTDLYAIDPGTGDLLRLSGHRTSTLVGTGFSGGWITFGPDNALYVSEPHNNRILRVTPEPSTLLLLGMGAVSLLAYAWRRRRR